MHKRFCAVSVTVAALLLTAAPALAAPTRTFTLSESDATFSWTSQPATGAQGAVPCASDGVCDAPQDVGLIKADDPGTLVVTTAASGPSTQDVDLALYASDAQGNVGELIMDSAGADATERTSVMVPEPGYYLAVVRYYTAVQGTFRGVATLHPPSVEWLDFAPRHKALTAEDNTFDWTGTGNGILLDCGATAVNECDYTLVRIEEAGDITADITTSPSGVFNYLQIYASNPAGDPLGEPLADGVGLVDPANPDHGAPVTATASGLAPGYYVVQMGWFVAAQDEIAGRVTFTPAPPEDEEL